MYVCIYAQCTMHYVLLLCQCISDTLNGVEILFIFSIKITKKYIQFIHVKPTKHYYYNTLIKKIICPWKVEDFCTRRRLEIRMNEWSTRPSLSLTSFFTLIHRKQKFTIFFSLTLHFTITPVTIPRWVWFNFSPFYFSSSVKTKIISFLLNFLSDVTHSDFDFFVFYLL